MAQKRAKFWRCGNGHILGVIRWNGAGVPTLLLYRQAVDQGEDIPEEVDVLGPLIGRMPVRCSVCGDVRLWDISPAALRALQEISTKAKQTGEPPIYGGFGS